MKNILIYGADRHLGFAFAKHVLRQGDTVTLVDNTDHQVRHIREQLIRLDSGADAPVIDAVCMSDVNPPVVSAAARVDERTSCVVFAGILGIGAADSMSTSELSRNIERVLDRLGKPQYVRVVFELPAAQDGPPGETLAGIKRALAAQLGAGVTLSITAVHTLLADESTPPPGIAPTRLHAGIGKILQTLHGVKKRSRDYFQQYPTWVNAAGLSFFNVVRMSDCVRALRESLDGDVSDRLIAGTPVKIETVLRAISVLADRQICLAREPQAALSEPVSCLIHDVLARLSGTALDPASTSEMQITACPMDEAHFTEVITARTPLVRSSCRNVDDALARPITLPSGLKYYSQGTGQHTVLIINAFGLSIDFWREFIQSSDTRFKFLIIEKKQPCSDSSLEQGYYTSDDFMSTLIKEVEAVMDVERAADFHIASWCAGGKLALGLASALPGRVRSLTFVTPSFAGMAGFAGADTTYERNLHMMSTMVTKSPQLAGSAAKSMMAAIAKSESDPTRFSPERKDRVNVLSLPDEMHKVMLYAPFATAENMLEYSHQVIRFRNHDITLALDDAAVLNLPVLVVTGAADTNTSTERTIDVFAKFANIVNVDLNDGSHFLLHQKSDIIAQLFDEFTTEHHDLRTMTARIQAASHWL